MTEETTTGEVWQIEAGGRIYDAPFEELTSWIQDGALLRIDRVRKGNLRWIEAGKVPALIEFFNAKDAASPTTAFVTTSTTTEILGVAEPAASFSNHQPHAASPAFEPPFAAVGGEHVCAMHPEIPAAYFCDTCSNAFCKSCPNSYGGNVRICPFCGAMCTSLAAVEQEQQMAATYRQAVTEGFGFSDFGRALAYPFRFKTSLLFGAILFMLFSIGQSATSFGGIFMLAGAIMSYMLANTLTFGVLANTVDNFTQGKIDENFMPSFDDFSLWDDVVHPFFLSIGVYLASFGPFIAVVVISVFMVFSSMQGTMSPMQEDAARTINPELPYAANSVKQSQAIKDLVNKANADQQRKVAALNDGSADEAEDAGRAMQADEDKRFEQLNDMIQQQRKAQLESAIGKTPETRAKDQQAMVSRLLGYGALFLLLFGVTLLWGLFYFPAACAVAGYTRSFTATLNPSVGFDTIRRLGSTYVLILVMSFLLLVMAGVISGFLHGLLAAFDLPGTGNLAATALTSLFSFYFSVVFSCIIGFALYKAGDRLQLYR